MFCNFWLSSGIADTRIDTMVWFWAREPLWLSRRVNEFVDLGKVFRCENGLGLGIGLVKMGIR